MDTSPLPFSPLCPAELDPDQEQPTDVSCIVGTDSPLLSSDVKDEDVNGLSPLSINPIGAESPDYISHLASPPLLTTSLPQGPLGDSLDTADDSQLSILSCTVAVDDPVKQEEKLDLEPNTSLLGTDDVGDKESDEEEDVIVSHQPTVMLHYRPEPTTSSSQPASVEAKEEQNTDDDDDVVIPEKPVVMIHYRPSTSSETDGMPETAMDESDNDSVTGSNHDTIGSIHDNEPPEREASPSPAPVAPPIKIQPIQQIKLEIKFEKSRHGCNDGIDMIVFHTPSVMLHYRPDPSAKSRSAVVHPEESRPLHCAFCRNISAGYERFAAHLMIHSTVGTNCCHFCLRQFSTAQQLRRHLPAHKSPAREQKSEQQQNTTRRGASSTDKHWCSACKMGFSSVLAMDYHMVHQCKQLKAKSKMSSSSTPSSSSSRHKLRSHKLNGSSSAAAATAKSSSSSSSAVTAYQSVLPRHHYDNNPYRYTGNHGDGDESYFCRFCRASFPSRTRYKQHRVVCEKQYRAARNHYFKVCRWCKKVFRKEYAYKIHHCPMRYYCISCKLGFGDKKGWRGHKCKNKKERHSETVVTNDLYVDTNNINDISYHNDIKPTTSSSVESAIVFKEGIDFIGGRDERSGSPTEEEDTVASNPATVVNSSSAALRFNITHEIDTGPDGESLIPAEDLKFGSDSPEPAENFGSSSPDPAENYMELFNELSSSQSELSDLAEVQSYSLKIHSDEDIKVNPASQPDSSLESSDDEDMF